MQYIETERFVYNGLDLSDFLLVNPVRTLTPGISIDSERIPGNPGEHFVRAKLDPLEINIKVRLKMPITDYRAIAKVRRLIAGALITTEPKELHLPDEPWLYYKAILTDTGELDNLWFTGGCTLRFTAYDPIAYGHERKIELTTGENKFVVGGTWETWPIYRMVDSGSGNVKIADSDGSKLWLRDLEKGKIYDYDTATQEFIALDGGNLPYTAMDAVVHPLKPGETSLTIEDSRNKVTVIYKERWV